MSLPELFRRLCDDPEIHARRQRLAERRAAAAARHRRDLFWHEIARATRPFPLSPSWEAKVLPMRLEGR